ncbi:DUF1223 domain-containing protein [Paracoccus albus]|uniref:DUF1223 domain-containing protein n=1 Tax=Paracoccus albus TaxID=3017784 RepID=UPI0022F10DBD|nr:DUF1223 domain-containing protein [Paracoccus albus]WBU60743.1 DUF1223 domain-containing protein [Paracoccus albus]
MLRKTVLPILLSLTLGLGPHAATADDLDDADGAESGLVSGDGFGDAQTQDVDQPGSKGDYSDIMDDVDAVIDAMDDAMGGGGPPGSDALRRRSPTSANTQQSPQPEIPQGPRTPSPIVVELFTAQGCDACPPAEEMMGNLKGRRDVLVLSWHVDYWDYLGWSDSFARPEFSIRQKGYNLSRGARSLFTPQVIVAGETAIDNPNPAALMTAVKQEMAEGDHVAISRRSDGARSEIELSPLTNLPGDIAIQLIRYLPARSVEVGSGENAGKNLEMHNVVVSADELSRWDGRAPLRLTVTLGAGRSADLPEDTRHALIVQEMRGARPGEIFATVRLD